MYLGLISYKLYNKKNANYPYYMYRYYFNKLIYLYMKYVTNKIKEVIRI